MWITYNKLWKNLQKRYLNIFLYCKTKINSLLTILSISTWSIIFIYSMKEIRILIGVYPKVLKFLKVHKKTHRRSGLLISKFAL